MNEVFDLLKVLNFLVLVIGVPAMYFVLRAK
jgi:hypothetical protein